MSLRGSSENLIGCYVLNCIRKYTIAVFLFLSAFFIFSDDSTDKLRIANKFYMQGDYEEALPLYEELFLNGYDNFNINYNLGLTYYMNKQPGTAVYYLEKAFYHSPYNRGVVELIDKINTELGISFSNDSRNVDRILLFFNPSVIFIIVVILIISFMVSVLFFILKRKKIFYNIIFSISSLLIFITILSSVQYFYFNKSYAVIIRENEASLYLSPYLDTVISKAGEGRKFLISGNEDNNFLNIRVSDILNAYVKKEDIKILKY